MSDINYPQRKRKPNNPGSTTLRDVNAATRVQTALRLKMEGATWEQVAAQAGYDSKGTAHHAVMRELDRCITHDVSELRTQQLYMLSQLQARCYKAGMDEKNKDWTWAIDRFVNLSKRISELMGLDIPVEQSINQNFTIVREIPMGYLGSGEPTI